MDENEVIHGNHLHPNSPSSQPSGELPARNIPSRWNGKRTGKSAAAPGQSIFEASNQIVPAVLSMAITASLWDQPPDLLQFVWT